MIEDATSGIGGCPGTMYVGIVVTPCAAAR
jgi:hypothetical protein